MQNSQAGSQEEQLIQGIAQALMQGQAPEDILKALVQQMGMPQDQAIQLIQAVAQQLQGGQEQAPEQMAQPQAAPEEEPMQPAMRKGGSYPWTTWNGNQGFAYGGVNPYMYSNPYEYMAMGGNIPIAQDGMQTGVPPRPQPEDFPNYKTFKDADEAWNIQYGEGDQSYTESELRQYLLENPQTAALLNPALAQTIQSPSPAQPASGGLNPADFGADLVKLLNALGVPSDFNSRKEYAKAYGIDDYTSGNVIEKNEKLVQAIISDPTPLKQVVSKTAPVTTKSAPVTTGSAPAVKSTGARQSSGARQGSRRQAPAVPAISGIGLGPSLSGPSQTTPSQSEMQTPAPSIPTVSLDSTGIDSASVANLLAGMGGLDSTVGLDTSGMGINVPGIDKNSVRTGRVLTPEQIAELKKKTEEERAKITKALLWTGAAIPVGHLATAYFKTKKQLKNLKAKTAAELAKDSVKDGEMFVEIMKKMQTPEKILEMAARRGKEGGGDGSWITRDEAEILKNTSDPAIKKQVDKMFKDKELHIFEDHTDMTPETHRDLLSADMDAEGFDPETKWTDSRNMETVQAYWENNQRIMNEIAAAAEKRGYKTAEDIKQIRELQADNDRIGKTLEKVGKPNQWKMYKQNWSDRFTKWKNLPSRIGGKFKGGPSKYTLVPTTSMAGANANRTLYEHGDVASLNALGDNPDMSPEMAKHVLLNSNAYDPELVDQARLVDKVADMHPDFEAVVGAYTQATGESPISNAEMLAKYHEDLKNGERTPFVQMMEAMTGQKSTQQRVRGKFGEGIKKTAAAADSKLDAFTSAITEGLKNAKNKTGYAISALNNWTKNKVTGARDWFYIQGEPSGEEIDPTELAPEVDDVVSETSKQPNRFAEMESIDGDTRTTTTFNNKTGNYEIKEQMVHPDEAGVQKQLDNVRDQMWGASPEDNRRLSKEANDLQTKLDNLSSKRTTTSHIEHNPTTGETKKINVPKKGRPPKKAPISIDVETPAEKLLRLQKEGKIIATSTNTNKGRIVEAPEIRTEAPRETPKEGFFEGVKNLGRNIFRAARETKFEYGGATMNSGGYVPDYGMAYGGSYYEQLAKRNLLNKAMAGMQGANQMIQGMYNTPAPIRNQSNAPLQRPMDNGPYPEAQYMQMPQAMYGMGMAQGGQMPQWLAERRFRAAGNENMMSQYGYEHGGIVEVDEKDLPHLLQKLRAGGHSYEIIP